MVEPIFVTGSLPKLAAKARLKFDKVREKHLLLLPERVVVLNETAASILQLCDGSRTLNTISDSIRTSLLADSVARGSGPLPDLKTMEADISEFLQDMADQGWVVFQHETEKL